MMRRLALVVLTAVAIALPATGAAGVPGSDAQLWTEADVTLPLTSSLSATALGVVRDGDGLPNPTLAGGGLTLDAKTGPWTLTVGDLWVAVRIPPSGATLDVDLPLVAVTYGVTVQGFGLSDRNRLEQLEGVPGSPWRYRNRVQVDHPVTGLGPVASVFASDEVFYESSQERWVRNRAQLGVGLRVRKRDLIQVYYLRQDDRASRPGALNALGLAYKVALK